MQIPLVIFVNNKSHPPESTQGPGFHNTRCAWTVTIPDWTHKYNCFTDELTIMISWSFCFPPSASSFCYRCLISCFRSSSFQPQNSQLYSAYPHANKDKKPDWITDWHRTALLTENVLLFRTYNATSVFPVFHLLLFFAIFPLSLWVPPSH